MSSDSIARFNKTNLLQAGRMVFTTTGRWCILSRVSLDGKAVELRGHPNVWYLVEDFIKAIRLPLDNWVEW